MPFADSPPVDSCLWSVYSFPTESQPVTLSLSLSGSLMLSSALSCPASLEETTTGLVVWLADAV